MSHYSHEPIIIGFVHRSPARLFILFKNFFCQPSMIFDTFGSRNCSILHFIFQIFKDLFDIGFKGFCLFLHSLYSDKQVYFVNY
ncbi:MAG: hypothetical protein CL859_04425 [Cyanobium sp. ARS6]|nr:hypothetical protein [Cyanobium sp. ARS6]